DEMFSRFLYAATARYARPDGGTSASVTAIDPVDVREFHQKWFCPNNAVVVIVGDVVEDEMLQLATEVFGTWRGQSPSLRIALTSPSDERPKTRIVMKTDAPQTELRIGHISIPRTHADYLPVTVMNAILGGLFSSRINLNLRERHGYTYSAHSSIDWRISA